MRTKYNSSGKVVVYSDNKTILKEYYKNVTKESDVTSEVGVIVAAIWQEIDNATIDISLEYSSTIP